jgi:hypothetical protein
MDAGKPSHVLVVPIVSIQYRELTILPSDGQPNAKTVVSVPGWPEAARNSRLNAARMIPSSIVLSKTVDEDEDIAARVGQVAHDIQRECAGIRILCGRD